MISREDIIPINLYTSKSPKSTGGSPDILLNNAAEVKFDKNSSFYGETIYRFFYAVYDTKSTSEIQKIKLSYFIDVSSVIDRYDLYFLKNFSINFFYLTQWRKNYIVELHDEFGYNTKTKKHVSEDIAQKEKNLEIFVRMNFGDFFPIGIEVSLNGPTERVYKLPIIIKLMSYAV
jgi:ribosome biogenesis protein Nip4